LKCTIKLQKYPRFEDKGGSCIIVSNNATACTTQMDSMSQASGRHEPHKSPRQILHLGGSFHHMMT